MTRLLKHRLKHDGVTFEDEASLKDMVSSIYLGACHLILMYCVADQALASTETVCRMELAD